MPILIGNNNSQPIEPSNFWIGGADGKPCQVQNIYIGDSNSEPKLVWTSDFGYSISTILDTNKPISETIIKYEQDNSFTENKTVQLKASHVLASPLNGKHTYTYSYLNSENNLINQQVEYELDSGYERNRTWAKYAVLATNLISPNISKPNSQTFYYYVQVPVCVISNYSNNKIIANLPYRVTINSYSDTINPSGSLTFKEATPPDIESGSNGHSQARLYQACFSSKIWIGDLQNINILFDPDPHNSGPTSNNWLGWASNFFVGKTPQLIFEVNTNKQKLRNIPSDTNFDELATAPRVIAI